MKIRKFKSIKKYAQRIIYDHYTCLKPLKKMIDKNIASANKKRQPETLKNIKNHDDSGLEHLQLHLIHTLMDMDLHHTLQRYFRPYRPRRTRRKKVGGYPTRKALKVDQVKDLENTLKLMGDHGLGPNLLITINPRVVDGEDTAKRKILIGKKISILGTILRRLNLPHYGLSIYEFPKNGHLHAHHAIYIPPEAKEAIKKWIEGVGIWDSTNRGGHYNQPIHCCPYKKGIHDSYLAKESQYPCPPAQWHPSPFNQFRPRSGTPFRGKRIHKTRPLIKLIQKS